MTATIVISVMAALMVIWMIGLAVTYSGNLSPKKITTAPPVIERDAVEDLTCAAEDLVPPDPAAVEDTSKRDEALKLFDDKVRLYVSIASIDAYKKYWVDAYTGKGEW